MLKGRITRANSLLKNAINTNNLVDEPGFEPGTSTMPTWRSCQTDLLAQSIWLLNLNPPRLISISYGLFAKSLRGLLLGILLGFNGAYLFIRQMQIEKPSKVQIECLKLKLH